MKEGYSKSGKLPCAIAVGNSHGICALPQIGPIIAPPVTLHVPLLRRSPLSPNTGRRSPRNAVRCLHTLSLSIYKCIYKRTRDLHEPCGCVLSTSERPRRTESRRSVSCPATPHSRLHGYPGGEGERERALRRRRARTPRFFPPPP